MCPTDTIAAIATPPGKGGVAIVRISGPNVCEVMQAVLNRKLTQRQATHVPFLNAAGEMIDAGIAIYFAKPNSFTGEDVLELHGHGGPVIVDLLLKRILSLNVRLARPGEFSERAFLNDKIDLVEAEAIADLIDAASEEAARGALRSLQGEFSKQINLLNEKIIYLRMYIEAAIDFTDEEIDFLSDDKIKHLAQQVHDDLQKIKINAKQGSLLREGIQIVISGAPNVGKSSLLNRLSGKDAAIVTDIPGTTRDVLREQILIDGMPLHIIDTAGLRDSDDVVEQEGIRRAQRELKQADLVLYVLNQEETLLKPHGSKPTIFIQNKIDLFNQEPRIVKDNEIVVYLSAKTGAGINLLKTAIKEQIGFNAPTEGTFLARRRHLEAIEHTHQHIENSLTQLHLHQGELAAEELRLAHLALTSITGAFGSDDLLGKIFSSFCIGK